MVAELFDLDPISGSTHTCCVIVESDWEQSSDVVFAGRGHQTIREKMVDSDIGNGKKSGIKQTAFVISGSLDQIQCRKDAYQISLLRPLGFDAAYLILMFLLIAGNSWFKQNQYLQQDSAPLATKKNVRWQKKAYCAYWDDF